MKKNIARESVQKTKAYVFGEQPQMDKNRCLKLNTNENPYPPSPNVIKNISKLIQKPNVFQRYPHPYAEPLRSSIAKFFGINTKSIIVGNGSDEILSLICKTFINPKDIIVSSEITYSLYKTLVQISDANYISIPMKRDNKNPLQINLEKLANNSSNLILLSNPNAQTGEFIDCSVLQSYINVSNKLWIIDEAYNDFVEKENSSFIPYLKTTKANVIVTRSFSKSHSLAGMRIGYAVCSNLNIVNSILTVKDSYNEDFLAIIAGKSALEDTKYYKNCIQKIQSEKKKLFEQLKTLSLTPIASQANFILVFIPLTKNGMTAKLIYQKLKEENIFIRYFSDKKLKNYIRITVGSKRENKILLKSLKKLLR